MRNANIPLADLKNWKKGASFNKNLLKTVLGGKASGLRFSDMKEVVGGRVTNSFKKSHLKFKHTYLGAQPELSLFQSHRRWHHHHAKLNESYQINQS